MKTVSTRSWSLYSLMIALLALIIQMAVQPVFAQAETFPQVVSVGYDGSQSNSGSNGIAISADGRYVTFISAASNLIPDDVNNTVDLFTRDLKTGQTIRVAEGFRLNGFDEGPHTPAMSTDGRYIAYVKNSVVYLYDREASTTSAVGDHYPARTVTISDDGRYLWIRWGGCKTDCDGGDYIHDLQTGEDHNLMVAGNMSADGHFIVYTSYVYENGIYFYSTHAYNWQTGEDSIVSVLSDGTPVSGQGGVTSGDSRYVFFTYFNNDGTISQWYAHDLQTGETSAMNVAYEGFIIYSGVQSTNMDGRYVTVYGYHYNEDGSGYRSILIHDRQTHETTPVSIGSNGIINIVKFYQDAVISADGTHISFSGYNHDFSALDVYIVENPFVPKANPGPNQTVKKNAVATLDGSMSTDPSDNYPLSYMWSFVSVPTGSNAIINNPTSASPTFVVDEFGTYVVSLVVTNSVGATSSPVQVKISTGNTPPVADADKDQSIVEIGSMVTLNGNQSYDVDGDALTYQWTFVSKPDGSNAEFSNATSVQPTFTADVHGDYVVSLVVSDEVSSSKPAQVTVSFDNVQPVANAGTNLSSRPGDVLFFRGYQSNDANGDNLSYYWRIVSAPAESQAVLGATDTPEARFIPDVFGQYVISLVVNDGFVDSKSSNICISIIMAWGLNAAEILIETVIPTINNIPIDLFNNPSSRDYITNKIGSALSNIDEEDYAKALSQIQNDVLTKTDGCATTGAPDKDDWITVKSKTPTAEEIQAVCTAQGQVHNPITEAIGYLQNLQ